MTFQFFNEVHQTTAQTTSKDYHLTRRQVRGLWMALCGDLDCCCGFGGVQGKNRYRLKPRSEGGEIIP